MSSDSKEEVRDVPFSVEVDNTLESILIVLSAKENPGITLINPSGKFTPMRSLDVMLQYLTHPLKIYCHMNAYQMVYRRDILANGKNLVMTDDPNNSFREGDLTFGIKSIIRDQK